MAHAVPRLVRVAVIGAIAFHISHISHPTSDHKAPSTPGSSQERSNGLGRRIVAQATAQRGIPYSWGGGGTTGKSRGICCSPGGGDGRRVVGFDCSGLVLFAVYQATGGRITLPRVASDQVRRGRAVTRAALRPGDLIGFDHGQGVTHIGIYVGDGRMVHAPQTGDVVKISSLASRRNQRWVIRRLQ